MKNYKAKIMLKIIAICIFIQLSELKTVKNSLDISSSSEYSKPNKIIEYRKKLGEVFKSFMDTTVDPCDNFYDFVCGNYEKVTSHREYFDRNVNFYHVLHNLMGFFEQIINKKPNNSPEYVKYSKGLENAKNFYNSCMAKPNLLNSIEKSEEYLEFLKKIGGFPAVDKKWKEENFDWLNMSAELAKFDVKTIFEMRIHQEYPFNPIITANAGFGLGDINIKPEDFNDPDSKEYTYNRHLMRHFLNMYGAKTEDIEKIIEEIYEFGKKIVELQEKSKERNDVMDGTVELVSVILTDIDWKRLLEIIFDVPEIDVTSKLDILDPMYFYFLKETVQNASSQAIANYLSIKFLSHMHSELQYPKYHKEYCLRVVQKSMSVLFSKFYLEEVFDNSTQSDIRKMFDDIKLSFLELIEEAEWLDDETRHEMRTKVQLMNATLGYIDDPMIDLFIEKIQNLNISTENFYDNMLKLEKLKANLKHLLYLNSDTKQSTKTIELYSAIEINANYIGYLNSIMIFAILFSPPFYKNEYPNSLKFGAMGSIIAHEMSHSLDTSNMLYDATGTLRYWWSNTTEAIYLNKTACLENQYSNFFMSEIWKPLDGKLTLNENIADNLGHRLAFRTYKKFLEKQKKNGLYNADDEIMPGLNLTDVQTFFLGNAQYYCSAITRQNLLQLIGDVHSVDRYRIIGVFRNSAEFSEVFNCPVGSKMNPVKKCRIL